MHHAACSLFENAEYEDAYAVTTKLHRLFTYHTDQDKFGEVHRFEVWDGETPIHADCEEFAYAARVQMEKRGHDWGVVYIPNHVMTCNDKWCIDNLHATPFEREE